MCTKYMYISWHLMQWPAVLIYWLHCIVLYVLSIVLCVLMCLCVLYKMLFCTCGIWILQTLYRHTKLSLRIGLMAPHTNINTHICHVTKLWHPMWPIWWCMLPDGVWVKTCIQYAVPEHLIVLVLSFVSHSLMAPQAILIIYVPTKADKLWHLHRVYPWCFYGTST